MKKGSVFVVILLLSISLVTAANPKRDNAQSGQSVVGAWTSEVKFNINPVGYFGSRFLLPRIQNIANAWTLSGSGSSSINFTVTPSANSVSCRSGMAYCTTNLVAPAYPGVDPYQFTLTFVTDICSYTENQGHIIPLTPINVTGGPFTIKGTLVPYGYINPQTGAGWIFLQGTVSSNSYNTTILTCPTGRGFLFQQESQNYTYLNYTYLTSLKYSDLYQNAFGTPLDFDMSANYSIQLSNGQGKMSYDYVSPIGEYCNDNHGAGGQISYDMSPSACWWSVSGSFVESTASTQGILSPLSVSCSPTPQQVGSSVACTATVDSAEFSANSPEIVDWTSDSSTGSFGPPGGAIGLSVPSCLLGASQDLPQNECAMDYTDSSAGNFTITAFYEGDSLNPSTSGSTEVAYRVPVNVNIWCRSSVGMVGHPDVCAALVDGTSPGVYPTGEVTLVANSTVFDVKPDDCQIGRISGTLGTFQFSAVNGCLFDVNSNVVGTAAVYAAYHGDNYYMPDVVATQLKFVNLTATSLSLSCSALTAPPGIQAKCTATVASDPPTGNVSWNATGSGSFSSDVCVLDNGTCGVTYSQSNASAATITALYEGDVTHAPSESTVTVAPVTNGTAFALQTLQTGVDVTLNGSTGTLVSIYTSDYPSQPSGTGTPPYYNALYIDVMVSGGTAGSATICYYGPEINSTTQMSYYSSGKWNAATNQNASAGLDVCGNIPAVSLTGTPIAIGDANSASGSLGGALHQLLANDLMIGGVAIPILYVAIAAVAAVILLGIAAFTIRKGRKQRQWARL